MEGWIFKIVEIVKVTAIEVRIEIDDVIEVEEIGVMFVKWIEIKTDEITEVRPDYIAEVVELVDITN
jgi:hypothetical protein